MQTNYERIKAMSVDEMAEWLRMYTNCAFCNQNFGSVPCSNCKQIDIGLMYPVDTDLGSKDG